MNFWENEEVNWETIEKDRKNETKMNKKLSPILNKNVKKEDEEEEKSLVVE